MIASIETAQKELGDQLLKMKAHMKEHSKSIIEPVTAEGQLHSIGGLI